MARTANTHVLKITVNTDEGADIKEFLEPQIRSANCPLALIGLYALVRHMKKTAAPGDGNGAAEVKGPEIPGLIPSPGRAPETVAEKKKAS